MNEYERAIIRLRLRRGQQRKAEKGGYAGGRPRYGYRAEGGELVPVPEERAVTEDVRRLRAAGGSYRQIAAHLQAEGIRPRSGGSWHPTMLARIAS